MWRRCWSDSAESPRILARLRHRRRLRHWRCYCLVRRKRDEAAYRFLESLFWGARHQLWRGAQRIILRRSVASSAHDLFELLFIAIGINANLPKVDAKDECELQANTALETELN
jgi:hypothetical protein